MNDFNQIEDFFSTPRRSSEKPSTKKGFWAKIWERLPSKEQLSYLPHVLSYRERLTVVLLFICLVGGIIAIPFSIYANYTTVEPDFGGSYIEGLIGTPLHINPLLAPSNDVDQDISRLIYAGLMKYDTKGHLDYDLAGSYSISDDGLNYTFKIRDTAKWQDNQPVTADDVIFTFYTAQNPAFGSPLQTLWQGVEISKKDSQTVVFSLKNKYAQFINSMTVGILPKHIWQDISPANFASNELNLRPIGSGPYKFNKIKQDETNILSYELAASNTYHTGKPYISAIIFKFYPSEDELIKAYNSGEIEGLGSISSQKISSLRFLGRLNLNKLKLPRYFAIFYNQSKEGPLTDPAVRVAIENTIDRDAVIKQTLDGYGQIVTGPLLDGILTNESQEIDLDLDKARKALDAAGWVKADDSKFRRKKIDNKNVDLRIELTTSSWHELITVAQKIKDQLEEVGIQMDIRNLSTPDLQQAIRNRDYQALLYGEALSVNPDPFSFWHSSQTKHPGLNLALFSNTQADRILEQAKQTLDPDARQTLYASFQEVIKREKPALFIYSPAYIYPHPIKIKNNTTTLIGTPSDRFNSVGSWYINTTRSLKEDEEK